MKILYFIFCILFNNLNQTLIDYSHKVRLHKGRLLMLEEGYNEKLENQTFLDQLDKIDRQLDQLQVNLDQTKVETFKEIDELTSKMTSDRNIDILSNFFQKQLAQKKFSNTIQNINKSQFQKLQRAIELRDKLRKMYEKKEGKQDESEVQVNNTQDQITNTQNEDHNNKLGLKL